MVAIGFGVEGVNRATGAVRVARGGVADQKAGGLQGLFARFTAVEDGANLKQGHVGKAAGLIAGGGGQQAGQQVGAEVGHLR